MRTLQAVKIGSSWFAFWFDNGKLTPFNDGFPINLEEDDMRMLKIVGNVNQFQQVRLWMQDSGRL